MLKKSLLVVALASLVACGKNDETVDAKKPTAELKILSHHVDISQSTEKLEFAIDFTDDTELASYKIDIHDDFDGHSHGRQEATYNPFVTDKIYTISGKTFAAKETLLVPNNVATGNYHFEIKYFDKSGNEGEFIVQTFEVRHPQRQAKTEISQPDFTKEIEISKGQNLSVLGKITDPDDNLDKVVVKLVEEEEGSHSGRTEAETPLFEKKFEGINAKDINLNLSIPIPNNAKAGHHILMIIANDKSGNYKTFSGEITIK